MAKAPAARNGTKPHGGKDPAGCYELSLEIENVRCFGPKQTLDLSDGNGRPTQGTIIVGENGNSSQWPSAACDPTPPISQLHFTSSGRYFTGSVPWLNTASWNLPRSNASPRFRCTSCRRR